MTERAKMLGFCNDCGLAHSRRPPAVLCAPCRDARKRANFKSWLAANPSYMRAYRDRERAHRREYHVKWRTENRERHLLIGKTPHIPLLLGEGEARSANV